MKLLTWSVTVKASRSSGHSEPLLPFIAVVPRALELLAIAPEILAGRRGGLVSTTHPGDPGPVSAQDSWSNSHTALASLAKALYRSPLSFHLSSGQLDERVPGPAGLCVDVASNPNTTTCGLQPVTGTHMAAVS